MSKKKKEYYTQECSDYVKEKVESGLSALKATQLMFDKFNLKPNLDVERHYRKKIAKLGLGKPVEPDQSDEFIAAKSKEFDPGKKRFLISWAQSETAINEQLLTNMEAYAKEIDASIHIIAGRYKNPTSLATSNEIKSKEKNKSLFWDKRTIPYLDANRQNIHEYLSILSDVKIQPTATTPLSGLNSITSLESCIVGHPRVHLKSLPILDGYPHKLLLSTGAITVPNYTDTKSGKKGDFHHTYGFVIVELDGENFHIRQVQSDDSGSFYDLFYHVENGEVGPYFEKCPALIFGDLHLTEEDKAAVDISFEMAEWAVPEKIVLHDVFAGASISHHEAKDPFQLARREDDGSWDFKSEVDYMVDWFRDRHEYEFVSVMSNHLNFVDRWLMNSDWRKTPNKSAYLELAHAISIGKAPKGVVPMILDSRTPNVLSLSYNDSFRVGDWELSRHGDYGANGSRGSIIQFKNLNTKIISGHSHSPQREDGAIIAGTLTKLRLGYNDGLSSWMNSNVLIYPNHKASHIHIISGRYTTLLDKK